MLFLRFFTVQTSMSDRKVIRSKARSIAGHVLKVLLDFSLTVKAATLMFISWCGSAISSAKEGISGFIYNLLKSK